MIRRLLSWVEKFDRVPILVVGDLMLDRSLSGDVNRISPEAPVPVLEIQRQTQTPGGAGNVAANLKALGAAPTLISIYGDDPHGQQLHSALDALGVGTAGLFVDPDRPTITKTRVIAGQQQIVRLDQEKKSPLSSTSLNQIISFIKSLVPSHRAVVLSDYGKGVIVPMVIKSAIREAHRHRRFLIVDPKIEHFFQYRGVDCITPNTKESIEGMRVLAPKSEEGFLQLGSKIMSKLRCKSLLMTRGEKGMLVFQKGKKAVSIAAVAREVFDVTGAGDTVIATFTLARAIGAPIYEAAYLANLAASVVVGKVGTAAVTKAELIRVIKSAAR